MNKTRKELIEIINRQLLATKPPFLRNSVYFSVSEATDLLRELEDDWISVDESERLPEEGETVWICSINQQTAYLGCYLYIINEGWFWAKTNNTDTYVENGKIVAECEIEDLEVTHWKTISHLPQPPKTEMK